MITPRGRRAAVPFILVTVFLDVLSFGIAIPVLPEMVRQLTGETQGNTALWFGAVLVAFAVMQFLCAPMLGALSDRFGRRKVLLASSFGMMLDHLIVAFAPTVIWLVIGRALSGVTAASFPVANAYIADVTEPQARAKAFGMVGAAFGMGFVLGPLLGGVLGAIDLRLPFLAAAAAAGVSFLYGLFLLPESLEAERRATFRLRRANPVASLATLRLNPVIFGLALTFMAMMTANGIMQATWVLYTSARYEWGTVLNGISLTLVGLAAAAAQGGVMPRLEKRFGTTPLIFGAMGLSIAAFVVYGLAPAGWIFMLAILPHALGSAASPIMQAVVTRTAPPDRQGAIQGGITSLNNLTMIFAPGLGALLFSIGNAWGPALMGLPFLAGALFLGVALMLARHTLTTRGVDHATPPLTGRS